MVAAGIGNAAPQTARAVDQKAVGLFLHTAAQSCQQLSRGAEPVGFLQTEPSSVEDLGIPLRPGSSDAQHRDQVGDGAGVDGHALQFSPTNRYGTVLRGNTRTHGGQNVQNGPVPLRGGQIQSVNSDALRGQGAHTQEEGGIGPVSFGGETVRETKALSAGNVPRPPGFPQRDAAPAEGVLRHSDISGGFQSAGNGEGAALIQQGQSHQ